MVPEADVPSHIDYDRWWDPDPERAAERLVHLLPKADVGPVLALVRGLECPDGMESLVFLPGWHELRRQFPVEIPNNTIFFEALFGAIALMKRAGWQVECYVSRQVSGALKPPQGSIEWMRPIMGGGERDVFPLWVQLGASQGGRSPMSVVNTLVRPERVLDPATVGVILALFAENIERDMWIDCPGLMYAPHKEGHNFDTPRWEVNIDRRTCYLEWNFEVRARHRHGTATAIVPNAS